MLLVVLLLLEVIFLHIKSIIPAELITAGSVAFAVSFFFQPRPNQPGIETHDWQLQAASFRAGILLWCSSQVESTSLYWS